MSFYFFRLLFPSMFYSRALKKKYISIGKHIIVPQYILTCLQLIYYCYPPVYGAIEARVEKIFVASKKVKARRALRYIVLKFLVLT
jgi:hypothetical protein